MKSHLIVLSIFLIYSMSIVAATAELETDHAINIANSDYKINTKCELIYGIAYGVYPNGENLPGIKIDNLLANYPEEFKEWAEILQNPDNKTEFFKKPIPDDFREIMTTIIMKEASINPNLKQIVMIVTDSNGKTKLQDAFNEFKCKNYFDERIANVEHGIQQKQEKEIDQKIQEIQQNYAAKYEQILSKSFDPSDFEKFIGTKKLQEYKQLFVKINSNPITAYNMKSYQSIFEIDWLPLLTAEEQEKMVEFGNDLLAFYKESIKIEISELDKLAKQTENEIQSLDIPEKQKVDTLSKFRQQSEQSKTMFVSAAAATIQPIEEAVNKQNEKQKVRHELLGQNKITKNPSSGGCLIATATYGSELAPQVQLLREVRDNVLFQTSSGTGFMTTFNSIYYSFSPTVADWERQNPVFKEAVKVAITPMLSTLSILNYANIDSEQEMLGYGIGIILLNVGMYFVLPAIIILKLKKKFIF